MLHGRNAISKGLDRLGRESQTLCYYSVPEPISEQWKSEITSEKKADAKRAEFASLQKQILKVIKEKPWANTDYIRSMVHKRSETVNTALEDMLDRGIVEMVEQGSSKKWFVRSQAEC